MKITLEIPEGEIEESLKESKFEQNHREYGLVRLMLTYLDGKLSDADVMHDDYFVRIKHEIKE